MTNYEYIRDTLGCFGFEPLDTILMSKLQTAAWMCRVMDSFSSNRSCDICPMIDRDLHTCSIPKVVEWLDKESEVKE